MYFQINNQLVSCLAALALPSLAVAFIFRRQLFQFALDQVLNILYCICMYWMQAFAVLGVVAACIGVPLTLIAETGTAARSWGFATLMLAIVFLVVSHPVFKSKSHDS